jgi:hypothetical protein
MPFIYAIGRLMNLFHLQLVRLVIRRCRTAFQSGLASPPVNTDRCSRWNAGSMRRIVTFSDRLFRRRCLYGFLQLHYIVSHWRTHPRRLEVIAYVTRTLHILYRSYRRHITLARERRNHISQQSSIIIIAANRFSHCLPNCLWTMYIVLIIFHQFLHYWKWRRSYNDTILDLAHALCFNDFGTMVSTRSN